MKLYENQDVVNQLKRILKEDYPYLEYADHSSQKLSKDFSQQVSKDFLRVRVRPRMEQTARDRSVIEDICEKLYQATEIHFVSCDEQPSGYFYTGADPSVSPQKLQTQWEAFSLRKRF